MSLASATAALPKTRFATSPPWLAGLVLAAVAALIVFGLAPTTQPTAAQAGIASDANDTDLALYRAIDRRVAAGQGYYAAATAEQRARDYPLRPFVTVRLPTLAMVHATLGSIAATGLLWSLTLAAGLAMTLRLRRELGPGRPALYASAFSAMALGPILAAACVYWHEPWAAVLMTLSLAVRSRDRWVASVLLGFAAVAFRELALPYLCVMAVAAVVEARRREAGAWVVAIVASAMVIGLHAALVARFVTPADLHSPGWGGLGGWRFVLRMAHGYTAFGVLPPALVAVLVPLALLGWAAWHGPLGPRGALLLGGYAAAFMIVGRADNDYWGMLMAPLLPIGLVLAPSALRDLVVAARDGIESGRRERAPA